MEDVDRLTRVNVVVERATDLLITMDSLAPEDRSPHTNNTKAAVVMMRSDMKRKATFLRVRINQRRDRYRRSLL